MRPCSPLQAQPGQRALELGEAARDGHDGPVAGRTEQHRVPDACCVATYVTVLIGILISTEEFAAMQDAVAPGGPVAQRLHAALLDRFAPFVAVTSGSCTAGNCSTRDENSRACGDITRASRQRSRL